MIPRKNGNFCAMYGVHGGNGKHLIETQDTMFDLLHRGVQSKFQAKHNIHVECQIFKLVKVRS